MKPVIRFLLSAFCLSWVCLPVVPASAFPTVSVPKPVIGGVTNVGYLTYRSGNYPVGIAGYRFHDFSKFGPDKYRYGYGRQSGFVPKYRRRARGGFNKRSRRGPKGRSRGGVRRNFRSF